MALGSQAARKRAVGTKNVLKTATLRDFSGLWNAADNPLNLQSRFLTLATNVVRHSSGCIGPRFGFEELVDITTPQTYPCSFYMDPLSNRIQFTFPNKHAMTIGALFDVSGMPNTSFLGLNDSIINRRHRLLSGSGDEVSVVSDWWSSAGTRYTYGGTLTATAVSPTGNIVDLVSFIDTLVFVTDTGDIGVLYPNGQIRVLWSPAQANLLNRVDDTGEQVNFLAGSNLVSLVLPNADGQLQVGDPVFIVSLNDMTGIPAGTVGVEHNIVIADQANDIYQIRVRDAAAGSGVRTGTIRYSIDNGWIGSNLVTHAVFNREMMFFNGVDKPVAYNPDNAPHCNYLKDPVDNSNFYVPVGQFVAAGSDYVAVSGAIDDPATLYISSKGTNNTYVGAPEPNDSVKMNLSKVVSSPTAAITGLCFYKDMLFVGFEDNVVVYKLGTYTNDLHTPQLVSVIPNFGVISHQSMVSTGELFLGTDYAGLVDVRESVLGEDFKPLRPSEIIGPHILKSLTEVPAANTQTIWSLLDRRASRYMLFVPTPSEWLCYCYHYLPTRKVEGWTLLRGLNFTCGARSPTDRLYTANGPKIYKLGNELEPIYWDDGLPIEWHIETPWVDFNERLLLKKTRFIHLDTTGSAPFRLEMYADYTYEDYATIIANGSADNPVDYNEFTLPRKPALAMDFVGPEVIGFGGGDQPYAGGRITNDARGYAWPALFKIFRFRFYGKSIKPLQLVSLSLAYQPGSIRR